MLSVIWCRAKVFNISTLDPKISISIFLRSKFSVPVQNLCSHVTAFLKGQEHVSAKTQEHGNVGAREHETREPVHISGKSI